MLGILSPAPRINVPVHTLRVSVIGVFRILFLRSLEIKLTRTPGLLLY